MIYAERVVWADILKVFAIVGVIVIHSSAPYLMEYEKSSSGWWAANLYDSICRWCIPVFFMLSGTFILEQVQKQSLRSFFLKRLKRICIPFFFWSAVYFFWRISVNNEKISFTEIVRLFVKEPAYYHLWFIYTLIGLYFLSPFIGVYLKHASKANIRGFLLMWFVLGSFLPTIELLFSIETYLSIATPSFIFYYAGYFVLGYLLKDVYVKRIWLIFLIAVFLMALFFTMYGTYILTVKIKNGVFTDALYEYFSVNVLLMSIPVFLVFKSIKWPFIIIESSKGKPFFHSLALSIPGIYLVHAMVVSFLKRGILQFMVPDKGTDPWIAIPWFASIVLSVSFCFTYVIRLIPGIRSMVP